MIVTFLWKDNKCASKAILRASDSDF